MSRLLNIYRATESNPRQAHKKTPTLGISLEGVQQRGRTRKCASYATPLTIAALGVTRQGAGRPGFSGIVCAQDGTSWSPRDIRTKPEPTAELRLHQPPRDAATSSPPQEETGPYSGSTGFSWLATSSSKLAEVFHVILWSSTFSTALHHSLLLCALMGFVRDDTICVTCWTEWLEALQQQNVVYHDCFTQGRGQVLHTRGQQGVASLFDSRRLIPHLRDCLVDCCEEPCHLRWRSRQPGFIASTERLQESCLSLSLTWTASKER